MDKEDIPFDAQSLIRFGQIISVDLAEGRCIVRAGDPDGDHTVSGSVRWLAGRAGKTRIWSPPSIGEQVLLICPGGEIGNAVAITGIFYDGFSHPSNAAAEMISFEDGATVVYDPQIHEMAITLPDGGAITITAPQSCTINAQNGVTINGDVTINGTLTATDDVIGGGKSLKSHKHLGVQTGGGVSGAPQ